MKASAWCVLCCLLLLPACGGSGDKSTDGGDGGGDLGDGALPGEAGAMCKPYQADGTSCAGGGTCKTGETCVKDGAKGAPVCRVKCKPTATDQCGAGKCGRLCVGLLDSTGKKLEYGACVAGWITEGEPCGPGVMCDQVKKLQCIGGSIAFCRKQCIDAKDCKGYKIACLGVTGKSWKVCGPSTASSGVKEGGDCSKSDAYCAPDHLCDPATKKCLKLCSNLKSSPPSCGYCANKTCKKITDTAASVTLGWACVPNTIYDAGVPDCTMPEAGIKEAGVKEAGAKEGGTKEGGTKEGGAKEGGAKEGGAKAG